MELVVGLALGAGALVLMKRGRKTVRSAIGWTARKTGWVTGQVRSSLSETAKVARAQFERGRMEAIASTERAAGATNVAQDPPALSTEQPPMPTTTTTATPTIVHNTQSVS